MKSCNEFAPLLSAYFDGELTEEACAELRAHLEECEACRARLGEYAAMRAGMSDALEEEEVPADFTDGVMAAVRAEKSARKRKVSARRYLPVAACAAVVLLAASLFPGMHRMGSDSVATDTAARQNSNSTVSYAADSESAAPSESGDQELMQEYYDSVQGSAYYTAVRSETTGGTAPESAMDSGTAPESAEDGAPMLKNGADYDGLVYSCEVREINGEGGLLWVHQHGAVTLELLGAGATAYVEENGGVKDGDAGYYYLPVSALYALPEGIALSDVQAAELACIPEDAEWVLVCPDDASEGALE